MVNFADVSRRSLSNWDVAMLIVEPAHGMEFQTSRKPITATKVVSLGTPGLFFDRLTSTGDTRIGLSMATACLHDSH